MKAKLISKRYALPFALITTLFFLWGFARAILDVLNKHFQSELSISITRSTMIQTVTYLGYFLMAIPAGIMITRRGYRRGVVTGLICFGVGALMFIPGAAVMSFPLYCMWHFCLNTDSTIADAGICTEYFCGNSCCRP